MSSQHLPECYYGEPVRGGHITDCICERLRAAEQRVNAKWAQTRNRNQRVQELIAEAEKRGKNLTVNWAQAYADGWVDGVDKAHDVVDRVPVLPGYSGIRKHVALAAIDALRDRAIAAELTRDGQEQA